MLQNSLVTLGGVENAYPADDYGPADDVHSLGLIIRNVIKLLTSRQSEDQQQFRVVMAQTNQDVNV